MLANLQQLTLTNVVNLEFGWVKYWQMAFRLPNPPKFSPAKIFSLYGIGLQQKMGCVKLSIENNIVKCIIDYRN